MPLIPLHPEATKQGSASNSQATHPVKSGLVPYTPPQKESSFSATKDTGFQPPKQSYFDSHPWLKKALGFIEEPAAELRKASGYVGEKLANAIPQTETEKKMIRSVISPEQAQAEKSALESSTTFTGKSAAPAQSGKEAIGAGLKGSGELATFAAPGIGTITAGAGAAAVGGALEQNKSLTEAGIEGGLSAGATFAGGKLLEHVIAPLIGKGIKGAINTIGRLGRGLTEAEVGTIQAVPKITEEYFNKLEGAGNDLVKQQKARSEIESELFDKARDTWGIYSKKAGDAYEKEMVSHNKNLIKNAPPIDKNILQDDLVKIAEKHGADLSFSKGRATATGANADARAVFEKVFNKIKSAAGDKSSVVGDLGFEQLNALRKDIGGLYDSVASGAPEKRIVDDFYSSIKQRMMSLSKNPEAVQKTFDSYKEFLDNKSAFKGLTSGKSDPATVRKAYLEISRALTGQKGTGEFASAMSEAELAGGLKPDELAYRVQALDLAGKLAKTRITGTTEKMIASGIEEGARKIPTSLGELVTTGGKELAKAMADKSFMKNLFQEQGMKISNPLLSKLQNMLKSPATRSVMYNLIRSMMENEDTNQE